MASKFSRREFLGTTAAGGLLLAGGLAARPTQAAEESGWPQLPPVKIHVVYLGYRRRMAQTGIRRAG